MERLKSMKEALVNCVEGQLYGNMQNVNAEELGEAVDMIKDLSEAIYYCTITEEMKECKEQEEMMKHMHQYMSMPKYQEPIMLPEVIAPSERMYYNGGGSSTGNSSSSNSGGNSGGSSTYARGGRGGRRGFSDGKMYYEMEPYSPYPMYMEERSYPTEIRDFREGRSPMTRRNYMESKELHQGKEKSMKELEKYIKELGEDISEMIRDAEPEEKMILSQKLNTLAEKVR